MLLFLDLTSSRLGTFHQFSGRVEVLQLLSLTLNSLFLPGTFPLSCSCLALSLSPYCSFFSPLAWPICHINEKAGPLWFCLACRCDEMERWWERGSRLMLENMGKEIMPPPTLMWGLIKGRRIKEKTLWILNTGTPMKIKVISDEHCWCQDDANW